ncbi:MAG: hypothetical protein PW786_09250 [Arachidicoccus sp.]|nr:hypothetical protein [Arachidicoccus sp.]
MIPLIREKFNKDFSQEKYLHYLDELKKDFPGALDFRVAETPVFIDNTFKEKLLNAGEAIIDTVITNDYITLTNKAIPENVQVKGDQGYPNFLILDFGICENGLGEYEPMLVEMQAFPSLFAYQLHQYSSADIAYDLPKEFSPYLNNYDEGKAIQLLDEIIIGEEDPENVILLEIFPEKQKTRIDFHYTEKYLGISAVCVTQLIKEGRELFYEKAGRKIKIKRIYNRFIFDDLFQQTEEVQNKAKILFEDIDVKWVTHPNWFYRISKYSLPFIHHHNVPETFFLKDLATIPEDLENYVLKPLFSFAGSGVIIDVTKDDINKILNKENYILQRKVKYASSIKTLDENAKAEIRIFYFWKEGEPKPVPVYNLARMTKGNMISVALNKDKTWVGGTFALFE